MWLYICNDNIVLPYHKNTLGERLVVHVSSPKKDVLIPLEAAATSVNPFVLFCRLPVHVI